MYGRRVFGAGREKIIHDDFSTDLDQSSEPSPAKVLRGLDEISSLVETTVDLIFVEELDDSLREAPSIDDKAASRE